MHVTDRDGMLAHACRLPGKPLKMNRIQPHEVNHV